MINFRALPPINEERRKKAAPKVTQLLNGAKFEFAAWVTDINNKPCIAGRYLDYAGEWCRHIWDECGLVRDRKFAEMDLDWGTAR